MVAINQSLNASDRAPGESRMETSVQFTSDRILTIFSLSLFIPCIIAGNLLVIMAVVKTRYLRTVTNVFVVSLAVTDVSVGAISSPIYMAFMIKGHIWLTLNHPVLQKAWNGVDIITGVASIINLMNISIDRYMCIHYPFRYRSLMSARRSAMFVTFSWLFGLGMFSLMFVKSLDITTQTLILTVLAYLMPLFITITAYISIARVAGRQAQRIKGLQNDASRKSYTLASFLKEVKAARVLAVVVCAFILCWSGTFIVNLRYVICKRCSSCTCGSPSAQIINTVKMLQYFSSVVNPFIYTSLNKDFRKAMKRLVFRSQHDHRSSADSTNKSMRYMMQDSASSEEVKLHMSEKLE